MRKSQNNEQASKQDSNYFVIRNTGQEEQEEQYNEDPQQIPNTQMSDQSSKRQIPSRGSHISNSQSQRKVSTKELKEQQGGTVETPSSGMSRTKNLKDSSQLQSRNTNRMSNTHLDLQRESNPQLLGEGRIGEYGEEEENIICARFPHLSFCACEESCNVSIKGVQLIEVFPGIFQGSFPHGLAIKKVWLVHKCYWNIKANLYDQLLIQGVTHILNVTSREYKKRTKYFKYMNIDVYNKSDEDIKKHFRITNRFIKDCLIAGGKVFIHGVNGTNIAPCFTLAYLINNEKIPLKSGIDIIQVKQELQIAPNFFKQLERYDLEKLALVTLKKKNE